ncbi:MAG: tRNA (N6-threonylcarbamoyladenosine(37)-N6)-methyltransferase TrmO [Deltaproteobacteria bacterium]|nr:tRNA (N6-threonylcarbamoyladenosine(37)-N6)-methyltransferase TrmO [Deltaproteobacteria bacterium]
MTIETSQPAVTMEPIGTINSSFQNKAETPIQGVLAPESSGRVEIFPAYEAGLKDIEMFSHVILIYHLHQAGDLQLIRPTFLDDEPHGVFASRHPCRPNGLGLTVVRLERRNGRFLEISGLDVLDGTPLLDLKPYIPKFDCFPGASEGWVAGKKIRSKPAGRE